MKLLFFDDFKLGVLKGDSVVDVTDAVKDIPHLDPQDLIKGVIENWSSYKGKIESAAAAGSGKPLSSVKIRPPLPKPATVACMAVNYLENHTMPAPAPINAFLKSPHCVVGDGDTMVLPDCPATVFEGEAELAIVISKRAENVARGDAMSYVFGYVNFIDGSARGFPPFYQMKSRATFAPIGPFLVTADEVPDPHNLSIKLWNNGTLMQDFSTDDMGNDIPRCIEFITATHPLEAGDILATGTNHRGLHPFMDGDKVELEVQGMGRLHISIKDELKRKWKRETRLDRLEAAKARGETPGFVGSITPQLEGKYTPAEVKA